MTLSAKIIIATVIILIIYDIWAVIKWGPPGTLSVAAYRAAQKSPAVPFWAALLCSHLFMSQNKFIYEIAQQFPFIAFCGGYVSAWAFIGENRVKRFAQRQPWVAFLAGAFAGHAWASLIL